MIKAPTKRLTRHAIATYDFEWKKLGWKNHGEPNKRGQQNETANLELILAGVYDDENGYRSFTKLGAFLDHVLTPENTGRRFYAHFGGASDMVLLITELAKRKHLETSAIFSSSSAIMVTVEDKHQRRWTFLDSFWTMRVGLRKIGEWLGNKKGDLDPTKEHPLSVWKEYNEQDCKVLHQALTHFQQVVNEKGGELRVTGASTSLDLFLRAYLKRPIRNSPEIDEYVRPAYVASRVENLAKRLDEGKVYDINSSFPYSFTFPCPGGLTKTGKRISDAEMTDGLWCADVDVSVPEQFLPPLPHRDKAGKVYFPTGSWRARITSEDFKCGGFRIDKVHSAWHFEKRDDLGQFAHDLFALRQRSEGFDSQVWKIVVNSLYGKFAESPEKERLIVNPHSIPVGSLQCIGKGLYLGSEQIDVPHSHVPFSAFITARSRRFLREYAQAAYELSGIVAYLDTDSVMTPAELPTGKGLGQLKLEAYIRSGRFHGPKFYAYEGMKADKERATYETTIKAKGFSRVVSEGGTGEERLSYEDFVKLQEGGEMRIERMRRIKELLRQKGDDGRPVGFDYTADVLRTSKQLGSPKAKRNHITEYESRAWDVKEL